MFLFHQMHHIWGPLEKLGIGQLEAKHCNIVCVCICSCNVHGCIAIHACSGCTIYIYISLSLFYIYIIYIYMQKLKNNIKPFLGYILFIFVLETMVKT